MANNLFGVLPTFADGQVLSAEAHLNALQRHISLAYSDVVGVATPAMVSLSMADPIRTYTYAVRHQWNTLRYSVYLTSGTIGVYYDGVFVGEITGTGTVTGTITLTGKTVDHVYILAMAGLGFFHINYVYEEQTTSYPALASFANDTTPTAAQWQALATYAAAIEAALDVPQPVNTRLWHYDSDNYEAYHFLIHRGRYLRFEFSVAAPYTCTPGSGGSRIRVQLYAAGVEVFDQQYTSATDVDETIDLASVVGFTVAFGQGYSLYLLVTQNTSCEFSGSFHLLSMYETPLGTDAIAGWMPFYTWSHADWVWGSANPTSTAKKIQTIKANMQAIATTLTEVVIPSPARSYQFLYGVRRRRYLLYKTFSGEQCTVNWNYRGEAQQATLPESSSIFMSADMDSMEGLLPGTHYWIGGTEFALEDSHA